MFTRVDRLVCVICVVCVACTEHIDDIPDGNSADSGVAPSDLPDGGTGSPSLDSGVLPDAGVIVDLCDPVAQTGCTAGTQGRCVVEAARPGDGAHCEEPGLDIPLGAPCGAPDCAPGLACVQTSSIGSACRQVCSFETGTGCGNLGSEFDCRTKITSTNWGACVALAPICNPLTQQPCTQAQACGPFLRRNGAWEFRCREAGDAPEGEVCMGNTLSCERGLACVVMNGSFRCRRYCDDNTDCALQESCSGSVTTPPFSFCAP